MTPGVAPPAALDGFGLLLLSGRPVPPAPGSVRRAARDEADDSQPTKVGRSGQDRVALPPRDDSGG